MEIIREIKESFENGEDFNIQTSHIKELSEFQEKHEVYKQTLENILMCENVPECVRTLVKNVI